MTQEFHISVTPVGQNDYLVRTEQVAPGVPLAEELVTWPVFEWLNVAGHLMNDPLESILQGDTTLLIDHLEETNARNSVNLVALGQKLYNALFQGTLRDSLITAQGIAQNQQDVLRIRLGIKDTDLARLPWEVMHAGDRPIATGPYIAFSRYQSGIQSASHLPSSSMPKPPETGGVNVLMVIASPTDQVRLDLLKQEAHQLKEELKRHSSGESEASRFPDGIQVKILEQPGREELTQALEQGRFHILHYSGHSNLGVNGGEIYLVNRRTGLTEILNGDDLAGLLVNNNVQIAVFNSCLGTYGATNRENAAAGEAGERNLTGTLVKRGIKGVLAMSERIPDDVALTLTQLFYRNLSQGYSVDWCVSRMRQGLISAYGSHQMYWALPILYLHPEFDGYLYPGMYLPKTGDLDEYDINNIYSQINNDAELVLPLEALDVPNFAPDASEFDLLGEDDLSDFDLLTDEIDYQDPSYAEDSAMVLDLFRQLDQQKATGEESALIGDLQLPPTDTYPQDRQISENIVALDQGESWSERQNSHPESSQSQGLQATTGISGTTSTNEESGSLTTVNGSGDDKTTSTIKGEKKSKSIWSIANFQGRRRNIAGIVGVGAIAAVIGWGWWWQNQQSKLPNIPPIPSQTSSVSKQLSIDLKTSATGIVTAHASDKLSKGDLKSGLRAVEELLNRNALANAQTALKLVPAKHQDNPSFNFLWGRLIWQLIQTKDKTYSVDDARRYWENAVKAKPNSLLYATALGFAYYAEGNLNRANDSWFKAIDIAAKENTSASSPKTILLEEEMTQNSLTAYAGFAIGVYKSASEQPNVKKEQYLHEAIKLRQMLLKEDPASFQLNALANNWLWSEDAIKDWESLLQEKKTRG
ncbi:MAG: CHAT domain-containing protein [Calothrix sp. MO_167.B12]|nr:CHAT domain-containing protein [Calothrix sp. MO_167.B12]